MEEKPGDVIMPEEFEITHEEFPTPKNKTSKKKLLIIIVAIIGFLALAGSLLFIIVNSNNQPEPEPTKNSGEKYDYDEVQDMLTMVADRLANKDYVSAKQFAEDYSAAERMTVVQRYRYYSLLSELYSEDALNDAILARKFEELAERTHNLIMEGEE